MTVKAWKIKAVARRSVDQIKASYTTTSSVSAFLHLEAEVADQRQQLAR